MRQHLKAGLGICILEKSMLDHQFLNSGMSSTSQMNQVISIEFGFLKDTLVR